MPDFNTTTACSGPLVKDVAAIEQVLARYIVAPGLKVGVGFDFESGQPHLFVYGHAWPEAWPVPEGVPAEEFDAFSDGYFEHGAEGFVELLKELAPHLAEPIVVQAVGAVQCRYPLAAAEWRIDVGGSIVYVNGFDHGYQDGLMDDHRGNLAVNGAGRAVT